MMGISFKNNRIMKIFKIIIIVISFSIHCYGQQYNSNWDLPQNIIEARSLVKKADSLFNVSSYEEAAEDPQLRVNEMILETVHPRAGAINVLGTPLRIQNYDRCSRKNAPPELGEHNHEILRELGYTNQEIQEFEQKGVFG